MREEIAGFGPLIYGDLSQVSMLEKMAAQVVAQCPPPFTLTGFSIGGFVAREMIRQVPERVQ